MRNKRNIRDVSFINFGNKINKRGGIADLVSLPTATIIIVIILVLFMVFAGIVKVAERVENGAKIYNDTQVGVGDVSHYMLNYNRLVNVTRRVRAGEAVEASLKLEEYGKRPVVAYVVKSYGSGYYPQ